MTTMETRLAAIAKGDRMKAAVLRQIVEGYQRMVKTRHEVQMLKLEVARLRQELENMKARTKAGK